MSELKAAALIRDIADFPQPGIVFKDITPILSDPAAFGEVVDLLCQQTQQWGADVIVGIESRGFVFGAPMAHALQMPFAPVRKLGKLPYETIREEYALEYGTNTVEIHVDALRPGQRVVIVDDLLATGGTAKAASALVEKLGGVVAGLVFVVELSFLHGRDKLPDRSIATLIRF